MITLASCPVCQGSQITQYPQVGFAPHVEHEIMPQVFVKAAIITRYFVCQNCHVIFQNPRMSDKELERFYTQGYYRKSLNLTEEEINNDEINRAKYDARIIKEKNIKVESHLDIGCGGGYLLMEIGAKIKVGIEADMERINTKEFEVYKKLENLPRKSFDIVTAIHTLEHVSDPLSFLEKMVKLTSKGGHLVMEVPTWKSPGGPLRLAHLFHFEPDVLRLMCRSVGLNVIQTEFTPHLMLICRLESNKIGGHAKQKK